MRVNPNPHALKFGEQAADTPEAETSSRPPLVFDSFYSPIRAVPNRAAPKRMDLAPDKQKHFNVGFALGRYLGPVGLGLSIVLGAAKEVFDLVTRTGTPEWADFAVTVRGGWAGVKSWFV